MAVKPKSLSSSFSGRGISGRAFAFVVVLFLLAYTLAPPAQRYFAQRAQINALKTQLNESQSALNTAKDELAQWKDPKFIALQARTRLHFVYPGERQYIVLGIPDSSNKNATPAAPVAEKIPTGLPWYSRIISSITSTNVDR